jgi:hypothetical protein
MELPILLQTPAVLLLWQYGTGLQIHALSAATQVSRMHVALGVSLYLPIAILLMLFTNTLLFSWGWLVPLRP